MSRISLRELLESKETIFTAGAGDALTAKLIQDTPGIDGILSSGFAISAQLLARPDVEFYTRSDNVYAVRNMCSVIQKPLIADIDTGYGNAVSVIHSVHEFERAGVSGVIIEDQISPKRCPICVDETNNILPLEESVGKIRAAAENKLYKDTVIIARTDATQFDEAVRRAKAYYEAGADLVQPISRTITSKEEAKRFVEAVNCPVSLVIVGWLENLSAEDIREIGPKVAHFALATVTATHAAVKNVLATIGENQSSVGTNSVRTPHGEIVNFLGMKQISELEEKYLPSEKELFTK
jgi:2-methylisocitrate lyase-like PEP mutase family enzyme